MYHAVVPSVCSMPTLALATLSVSTVASLPCVFSGLAKKCQWKNGPVIDMHFMKLRCMHNYYASCIFEDYFRLTFSTIGLIIKLKPECLRQ